jgi:membrane protein DedA with SNARE-associated domain
MVNLLSFSQMLSFVQFHGYFLIFLIMIIEGPIITTAAAFAASLGYFNVWIILLLSFLGDAVGDVLAYTIGYFSRKRLVEKYGHFFGIKGNVLAKVDSHFRNHLGKTMFLIKMSSVLSVPGLMMAGASKVPLKKYVFWSAIIILPRAVFFVILGYSFGAFAGSVLHYYNNAGYYLIALVVAVILIYLAGKKIADKIVKWRDGF